MNYTSSFEIQERLLLGIKAIISFRMRTLPFKVETLHSVQRLCLSGWATKSDSTPRRGVAWEFCHFNGNVCPLSCGWVWVTLLNGPQTSVHLLKKSLLPITPQGAQVAAIVNHGGKTWRCGKKSATGMDHGWTG